MRHGSSARWGWAFHLKGIPMVTVAVLSLASVTLIPVLQGPADAAPTPVYSIQLVAVRTADSDGSDANQISNDEIVDLVAEANGIFAEAGIQFSFDPDTDVVNVSNTLLNNDCTIPEGVDATNPQKKPPCHKTPNRNARENYALNLYDGKVVVFFRSGGPEIVYSAAEGRWTNAGAGTFSFSSSCAHYLAFGDYPDNETDLPQRDRLLGHELGHYFHCAHTFGPTPDTIDEVEEKIRAYVEGPSTNRPKSEGLNAFNGDGLSDTPPDPGPNLWTEVYGDRCDATNPVVTVDWKESSGSTKYTLAPDRGNPMSYFMSCPPADHFSPQQIAKMRNAVEDLNRGVLIGDQPGAKANTEFDDTWSTGWTSFVPLTLSGQPYELTYKVASGEVDIHQLSEDGKDFKKVWEDTWTTGWTSFAPFNMDGAQHVLLYKRDQGVAKIIRINSNGLGYTTASTLDWSEGWTSLMPFHLKGDAHVLLYKANGGAVKIVRINAGGSGTTTTWTGDWTSGWTSFMPYSHGGLLQPTTVQFLIYKKDAGDAKILEVDPNGEGAEILWSDKWTQGWTSIMPLSRGLQDYFLLYKAGSGEAKIGRIRDDSQGYIKVWDGSWTSGWTGFLRFASGVNFLVLYKQDSGAMKILRVCL